MFAFQLTNLLDNALMSMHTTNILLFLPSSGKTTAHLQLGLTETDQEDYIKFPAW